MKSKWIETIRKANNDDYSGNGFVCNQHFLPEQIEIKKNKAKLSKDAFPTEFWVECIDIIEEKMEIIEHGAVEKQTENIEFEANELRRKMLAQRLNFEVREYKLNDIIKKQSNEIFDLKNELEKSQATIEKLLDANRNLKDDLLKSQTSTDITVNSSIMKQKYYAIYLYFICFEF